MKLDWKNAAITSASLVLGLIIYIWTSAWQAQAQQDTSQDDTLKQLADQMLVLTKNVADIAGQFKQVNIPLLNSSIQSIEGRTSRIETKLNITN